MAEEGQGGKKAFRELCDLLEEIEVTTKIWWSKLNGSMEALPFPEIVALTNTVSIAVQCAGNAARALTMLFEVGKVRKE